MLHCALRAAVASLSVRTLARCLTSSACLASCAAVTGFDGTKFDFHETGTFTLIEEGDGTTVDATFDKLDRPNVHYTWGVAFQVTMPNGAGHARSFVCDGWGRVCCQAPTDTPRPRSCALQATLLRLNWTTARR